MIPNVGNMGIHASGFIVGATPLLLSPVNVMGVARVGAGVYDVTLAETIRINDFGIILTPISSAGQTRSIVMDAASFTGPVLSVPRFNIFRDGVQVDDNFFFAIMRTRVG